MCRQQTNIPWALAQRRDVRTKEELVALRSRIDQDETPFLTKDQALLEASSMAQRIAPTTLAVLIHGETGSGKELMAAWIHRKSDRPAKPFVAVNCGAIPGELLESQLFGHKKGSFTGAVTDKPGLFQVAETGTLFLDELADLPLHMQVKLLRAIQEKSVRPVGAPGEIAVDVRILSATHKDLAALVKKGEFRQDLYYRINVIELNVPPLRERPDDIAPLARHILKRR